MLHPLAHSVLAYQILLFLLVQSWCGCCASAEVIRGVNLGGWLLTESWITPSVYSNGADDEWSLCNELGKKACLSTLQDHWNSFITKDDIEDIQSAGLNALRIPIGYWAVDLASYEPYVQGQYPYLIRAVNWAQEYGLTVLIDLHGAPGSQNGQDNSGLIGPVLFHTNTSNTDRSLNVLKNLTEEFSQDIYGGVVTGIELLNEPRLGSNNFTMDGLKEFYTLGSNTIRSVSDTINITVHDAFYGPSYWSNYDPSNSTSDTVAAGLTLDTHQYYAFSPLNDLPHDTILESICNVSKLLKTSNSIPPTIVGEWSLETGTAPNTSSSAQNKDNSRIKRTWLRLMFEAQLAAYSPNGPDQQALGWYFWNWKTEYDIDTWSYRRGLSQGYIPSNVGNSSTYAFPVLDDGCVDSTFNYTAPLHPTSYSSASAIRPVLSGKMVLLVTGVGGLLVSLALSSTIL